MTPSAMSVSTACSCDNDKLHPVAGTHSKFFIPSFHHLIENEAVVDRILQAIADFLLTTAPDDQFISTGRSLLRSQIKRHVEQNEPIEL
jgi:hypothetical protein